MTTEHPNPGNFANDPKRASEAGKTNPENKGFASENYPEDKQREVASMGGHASGGKFEEGSERAKEAGRKGGKARGNSGGSGAAAGDDDDVDEEFEE